MFRHQNHDTSTRVFTQPENQPVPTAEQAWPEHIEGRKLSLAAGLLWSYLCNKLHRSARQGGYTGEYYINYAAIQGALGKSVKTWQRAARELEAGGFICRPGGTVGGRGNSFIRYHLHAHGRPCDRSVKVDKTGTLLDLKVDKTGVAYKEELPKKTSQEQKLASGPAHESQEEKEAEPDPLDSAIVETIHAARLYEVAGRPLPTSIVANIRRQLCRLAPELIRGPMEALECRCRDFQRHKSVHSWGVLLTVVKSAVDDTLAAIVTQRRPQSELEQADEGMVLPAAPERQARPEPVPSSVELQIETMEAVIATFPDRADIPRLSADLAQLRGEQARRRFGGVGRNKKPLMQMSGQEWLEDRSDWLLANPGRPEAAGIRQDAERLLLNCRYLIRPPGLPLQKQPVGSEVLSRPLAEAVSA